MDLLTIRGAQSEVCIWFSSKNSKVRVTEEARFIEYGVKLVKGIELKERCGNVQGRISRETDDYGNTKC